MFGDKKLYKKLEATGKKAPAEVTAAKEGRMVSSTMQGVLGTKDWKLELMVRPEGGVPFTAQVERKVQVGSVVLVGSFTTVFYDPDDHSKVLEEQGLDGAIDQIAARVAAKPGHGSASEIAAALKAARTDSGALDPQAVARAVGGRVIDPAALAGAASAAGSEDHVAKLTRLADLRDRGVLSPEEFEAEKARILGQS